MKVSFAHGTRHPSINDTACVEGTERALDFVDVILSEPLISFVLPVTISSPALKLTWQVVSGILISRQGDDIEYEDTQTACGEINLVATMPLAKAIFKENKVYLDIVDSADAVFTCSSIAESGCQVGEQLRAFLIKQLVDADQSTVVSGVVDAEDFILMLTLCNKTEFEIIDPFPRILKGQYHKFSINSSLGTENLKWTIDPVLDNKGARAVDIGSIDECTGLYLAPPEVGENGFFQVSVSVVHQPTHVKCGALLSVFNTSILIYPATYKVHFNAEFAFQAVAHDNSKLEPQLRPGAGGAIRKSETMSNMWIYSPRSVLSGGAGILQDSIIFKSLTSESEIRGVIVADDVYPINYEILNEPGTYQFYRNNGMGKSTQCGWQLLHGTPGRIDYETGVYTCDPDVLNPVVGVLASFNDYVGHCADSFALDSPGVSLDPLIRQRRLTDSSDIESAE